MAKTQTNENDQKEKNKKCGIIMPIAEHPDYTSDHWDDVLEILTDAIEVTEFKPRLVSDDVAVGLIHDRIVTNIYSDDIVICDVSSKNPNVMFELGLRLAFDKPTIIIKDEKTGYSFDTGVIEHIPYPSTLRFNKIVDFKAELIKRINATYEKSKKDPNYSPFLKSFGKTIISATIDKTEIPEGKYIIEQLDILSKEIRSLKIEKSLNADKSTKFNGVKIKEDALKYVFDNFEKKYMYRNKTMNFDPNEFGELLAKEAYKQGLVMPKTELLRLYYDSKK